MNIPRIAIVMPLLWIHAAWAAPAPAGAQSAAPAEILRGRTADVHGAGRQLTGELLALQGDTLWIGGTGGARGIPAGEIEWIRIHRHGLDGRAVVTWSLIGAGLSTVGMTVACSSLDDNGSCAGVAGVTILSWGLFGGIFGWALARTSRTDVPASPTNLRPWLRYPDGLPPERRTGSPAATPSSEGGG